MSVSVYQTRTDYADRVLELRVRNDGPSDLDLTSARFDSPHFAEAAAFEGGQLIEAGQTRDLRVRLAPAVCDDVHGEAETVTLMWSVRGGGTGSATVNARDENNVLPRITKEDCLRATVDAVATITPPPGLRVRGAGAASVASIDLAVTPTGAAGTVSIERVGGTVLLAPVTGVDWPVGLTIDADSAPETVTLDLRPNRCDTHAVAEDKRGTILPITVRVTAPPGGPGERSGVYDLPVGSGLRGEIYDWIAAHCAG